MKREKVIEKKFWVKRVKEIRSPIETVIEIILDNRRERVKEIRSPIERVIEIIKTERERVKEKGLQ